MNKKIIKATLPTSTATRLALAVKRLTAPHERRRGGHEILALQLGLVQRIVEGVALPFHLQAHGGQRALIALAVVLELHDLRVQLLDVLSPRGSLFPARELREGKEGGIKRLLLYFITYLCVRI